MSTLLDTNLLSELLRATPEAAVLAWLAAQPADTLFVSAITGFTRTSRASEPLASRGIAESRLDSAATRVS